MSTGKTMAQIRLDGTDEEFRADFDAWRREMHSRCDPARGIRCPWCAEFAAAAQTGSLGPPDGLE